MASGTSTASTSGVLYPMTPTVQRVLIEVCANVVMVKGITMSTMSTSLENLFRMRPSGVTSKKWEGERRTFSTSASWREDAALIRPCATVADAISTQIPEARIILVQ